VKKALLTILVLGAVGGSVFAYYSYRKAPPAPKVNTAAIARGDVVDTVGATGTLQAVTTVQVGAQVSGIVQDLYADFNSLVKKGQVLARLDPSTIQTQIDQSKANLARTQADLERLKVAEDDAKQKLKRAEELSARSLIPQTDLETAQVNVRSAQAQVKSQEAAITQAEATLKQNQVSLEHTIIEAPIDGLVISRNVDRGQTVAASLQAPTLFILAADLTKMQVVANLDESDVGRIRPGQRVTFRVDAYAADTFTGTVQQVRLQPITQQNVVTYATVINVPNQELKLKPGMTANVNIEIARRSNVLRIPNAALRFRPTNEIYAALDQTPPADTGQLRAFGAQGGGRRGRGGADGQAPGAADAPRGAPGAGGQQPAPTRAAAASTAAGGRASTPPSESPATSGAAGTPVSRPPGSQNADAGSAGGRQGRRFGRGAGGDTSGTDNADSAAGGGRAGGGGGRGGRNGAGFADRLQNMSPDEREQFLQRLRARGIDPTAQGRTGSPDTAAAGAPEDASGQARGRVRGGARDGQAAPSQQTATVAPKAAPAATTIDALFGPLPVTETAGRVWLYVDKQLKAIRVRVGISDGQASELIEGDIPEGAEVVTSVITGTETRPAATGTNPLFGQPGRGGFPGGGGGGFGGGGGGRGRG
jgi:HlyD family secretion protein